MPLIKTWPATMSSMKRRCSVSSRVQALDPSPKVVALAISTASSMFAARNTEATGPKTSSV
ncbi:Uncharacterised protein [Mycobacterium tuberculosis]|uniref:Uncharacterized protein n=2 Tax=Mycobacterium tuberculosis TaxID=1773 RepID=A0A655ACW9_MYCTX|nr:Uncharacterised protein [Mycobacterium tuberculosis]SGA41575.1 Uncharacterised protein [Mycobacterium tuberculosis]SGA54768.1 Uncharacterised protein [Mycobacterium tuberculosis]SGC00717.1 Uncharacterised protein [Mycobacterium tuberculosis]SGC32752.1 Uncharacterised protein [Mycobacterium tuberculosis]